jgi:hypothetical protein
MSGIVSYRWGDSMGQTVVGFTTDPGVTYTIPTIIGNRDYDAFVAIGTETADPYHAPPVAVDLDYMGFWVGLITSTYYGKVKTACSTNLPTNTSATEFIALLGDAKAGARVEPILQASLNELLSIVTADATDQAYLNALLATTHLDTIYTPIYE